MSIQLSDTFKRLETWSLDQIPLKTTTSEAQNEWNKWNVIHIVSCIFSPLLITIPLIFHANRKMAEAKAQEKAALGLDAYRRKDWQGAVEHLEHLNEAPVKDIFKRKVEEKLRNTPSLLNSENEVQLGARVHAEAEEGLPRPAQLGTVIYPSDVAVSAIPMVCENAHDNKTIVLGALIGFAYLHQAVDELEKRRSADKLKVKTFTVISTQYLGRTRGKLQLVDQDFVNIRQRLRMV
ncbi:MAG: hypothetical protein JSS60_07795 [Verrucomicrobia bacterium]|nr:hypothetical protein [Verrucomicrobiota bacterium]